MTNYIAIRSSVSEEYLEEVAIKLSTQDELVSGVSRFKVVPDYSRQYIDGRTGFVKPMYVLLEAVTSNEVVEDQK